jgi:hypothetical protein
MPLSVWLWLDAVDSVLRDIDLKRRGPLAF